VSVTPNFLAARGNVVGHTSNSRVDDSFVAVGAGIDTVRFRFRSCDDAFRRFAAAAVQIGHRGDLVVQRDGVRLGCTRDDLVYAEGRLAAILEGPESKRLCGQAELADGAEVLRMRLAELGVKARDTVAFGRLDLASDLMFANGGDGLAMIRAASFLDVPRAKTGTDGRKAGKLESVTFRSTRGRRVIGRLYDKGVESASFEPGRLIRYERQLRYEKAREPSLADALRLPMRDLYAKQLRAAVANSRQVVAAPVNPSLDVLMMLADDGKITYQQAERLAGYLAIRQRGDPLQLPSRTRQRRERELREVGLVITDEAEAVMEAVPLGVYLAALESPWIESGVEAG
jgi:hypothetical protein